MKKLRRALSHWAMFVVRVPAAQIRLLPVRGRSRTNRLAIPARPSPTTACAASGPIVRQANVVNGPSRPGRICRSLTPAEPFAGRIGLWLKITVEHWVVSAERRDVQAFLRPEQPSPRAPKFDLQTISGSRHDNRPRFGVGLPPIRRRYDEPSLAQDSVDIGRRDGSLGTPDHDLTFLFAAGLTDLGLQIASTGGKARVVRPR